MRRILFFTASVLNDQMSQNYESQSCSFGDFLLVLLVS